MFWLALALLSSVALVVWRVEALARTHLAATTALKERELAHRDAPPKRELLPPDLAALADQEQVAWAREQVRAAIQDEYEARGDWDAVRTHLYGAH